MTCNVCDLSCVNAWKRKIFFISAVAARRIRWLTGRASPHAYPCSSSCDAVLRSLRVRLSFTVRILCLLFFFFATLMVPWVEGGVLLRFRLKLANDHQQSASWLFLRVLVADAWPDARFQQGSSFLLFCRLPNLRNLMLSSLPTLRSHGTRIATFSLLSRSSHNYLAINRETAVPLETAAFPESCPGTPARLT